MPIKEPLLFISVEDFKNWKGFDKLLFENVTNSDENIWFAISIASSNIDYLSGFAISKKWPEQTTTTFTDNVQTATAHYVRFLCTKGVDYTRGQASMAQGGIVYSENNPNDPYYIPPEVFNYLRNINEYTAFQGFNLDVKPKTSFFSKFLSNKGESNPLENYLQITNTIAGKGILIEKTHPVNIMGTVVTFNTDNNFITNEIIIKKEYPNLQTLDSTILGAINELYSFSKITVDTISFSLVSNFLKLNDDAISKRYNEVIEYPNLKTISKQIVGAINELYSFSKITVDPNSFGFTNNNLTLQDALVFGRFLTDLNATTFPSLNTNNKTILGGINENHEVTNTIQGRIDGLSLTILGKIDDLVLTKQEITDNALITTSKKVVGAINENHSSIQTKQQKFTTDNSLKLESKPTIGEVLSVDTASDGIVARTLLQINEYNDDLNTNDKRIIPAINEILAKIPVPPARDLTPSERMIMPKITSTDYTFDPKSFKVENNIIELQDDLIKERLEINKKQDKIIGDASTLTSGADGYINEKNQIRIYDAPKEPVATRIVKFNKYKDDLQTEDQTLIGAINELKKDIDLLKKQNNLLIKQHNYFHFLSEKDNKANEIIILIGQITIGNDLEKNVYTIASNNVINPPANAKYGTMTYLDLGNEFNCYKLNSETQTINKKIKGVWKNTTDTLLSCVGIDVNVNFDTKIATIIFREVKDRPSPTTLTLDLSSL